MTFLRSQRSKFIAWMFIYAFGILLMFSKGGAEAMGFVWGLALGIGAAIATCTAGPQEKMKRLGIVAAWLAGAWLSGFAILAGEGSRGSSFGQRAENITVVTLIAGGPALLALLVWIFKRPKLT